MKVYISGPITYDPNHIANFALAERQLREAGHTPLNPTIWETNGVHLDYEEYMTLDFAMLDVADAVALIPGWEESAGVSREIARAADQKKNVQPIEYFLKNM